MFQHTAARRRLLSSHNRLNSLLCRFQHTAARRRLRAEFIEDMEMQEVSTHSRAEAAAKDTVNKRQSASVSTHSRAEAAAPYIKK